MSHVEVKQFLKQMMMRHMKANAYLYPHLETWWKTSGLMDESWYLSEASSSHTDHPESAHQRFYSFCFHEACGPLEAGNRLQQLFQEWLGQESLSKEQISELLVLEQFLTILPGDIQQWVRKYQPQSIREAVALTEHFQRGPTTASNENVVTFEDVIVRFSEEEWKLLSHSQKTLCNDVMQETYEDALFLVRTHTMIWRLSNWSHSASEPGERPILLLFIHSRVSKLSTLSLLMSLLALAVLSNP